ncbi:hypothetical protein [Marinomonas mediterranea]|uniref:hypothetical protein n=1 Tax=Marinomonas mediterranea TaxID=119864 RepID=UPI00234B6A1C|nr:hypothetical protein [Marinomonas mediterranea]WCN08725.1 hypothetical protein GV055_07155 [Marinomonas mediterranea]
MSDHNILFIDLDSYKEFVKIAYIEGQRRSAKPIHFVVSLAGSQDIYGRLWKIFGHEIKDGFQSNRDDVQSFCP